MLEQALLCSLDGSVFDILLPNLSYVILASLLYFCMFLCSSVVNVCVFFYFWKIIHIKKLVPIDKQIGNVSVHKN